MAAMTLWWLFAAAALPIAQDESYYFVWARHLALGYFDHPPLVALLAFPSSLVDGSAFVGRLGTVAVAAFTFWVTLRLFLAAGLREGRALLTAMLLAQGNFLGFIYGFLTTPDTVLICSWTLALHETLAALGGRKRRWLSAGAACGLGLLSKYTMGLFLFVALIPLLRELRHPRAGERPALKTPWPWAGALVALLVFSPHLVWNAQHDWITLRFQLRHGFAQGRPDMPGKILPTPLPPSADSPEAKLAQAFADLDEAAKKAERKPTAFDPVLQSLNQYVGFYASQLVLWGLLLPVGIRAWWLRRRARRTAGAAEAAPTASPLAPHAVALFRAAAFVPLVVFGLISLGSKVEANWSGMCVIGAAALLAPALASRLTLVRRAVAANAVLLALTILQARTGVFPTRPHRDRVLLETHGYDALAAHLATLDAPVFADSFQLTAMTRFYDQRLRTKQWPGVTRDSELVRNPALNDVTTDELRRLGRFWLVTTDHVPPRLPGFEAADLVQLRDCKSGGLQAITILEAHDVDKRCKSPIHEWYLVRYQFPPASSPTDVKGIVRDEGA
jgi:4-amino-4-deoxy-L-arabinose transferase-like glycosyltransferase